MQINEFNNEEGGVNEEDEGNHKGKLTFTYGGKPMLKGAAKEKKGIS
jgi:hypothetical protein